MAALQKQILRQNRTSIFECFAKIAGGSRYLRYWRGEIAVQIGGDHSSFAGGFGGQERDYPALVKGLMVES